MQMQRFANLILAVEDATIDYLEKNVPHAKTFRTLQKIARVHHLPEGSIMDLHEDLIAETENNA